MDAAPAARLYLDHEIVPTRSLPIGGFVALISLVLLVNIGVGTMFVVMGAAPIPIFLGLDVLAVCIAFRASYRQARRRERVQVSADEVRVLRHSGERADTVWRSPTAFTRVLLEEPTEHDAKVRLMLSRRRLTIGMALGVQGRRDLARTVETAIHAARNERHPV
jgi:uncharacterized membrane protein